MANRLSEDRITHIVGLGQDGQDGHVRVTRGKHFRVLMGSEHTHEEMSALCHKLEALAQRRGIALEGLTESKLIELLAELN